TTRVEASGSSVGAPARPRLLQPKPMADTTKPKSPSRRNCTSRPFQYACDQHGNLYISKPHWQTVLPCSGEQCLLQIETPRRLVGFATCRLLLDLAKPIMQ